MNCDTGMQPFLPDANLYRNPTVSTTASDEPRNAVSHLTPHFSPASVGGGNLESSAAQVSRAYTDAYYRKKKHDNENIEHFQYRPPCQSMDDQWSGSSLDSAFWMLNSDTIIGKQCLGLTRAQRAVIDAPYKQQSSLIPDSNAPARFMESTKSRSRLDSSNTVSYPVLPRGNINIYTEKSYHPTYEVDTPII
ncbi:hypothetical protein TetV_160 [Tetraselmis virus 1]|uniref:Uncharacterized protein n=1 Tax=Tetraselmis virus 1 TaxID=2060617 RepID=A0A2P0VMX3_9VIRU|nr:hypothetical protein QJ968_gp160 [Tetraselmis virus 1]AUF82252.1 hypothetical protein TetV_160 [Tetraselmis virus 1]